MSFNLVLPEGIDAQSIAITILAFCLFALWRIVCSLRPRFDLRIEATNAKTEKVEEEIQQLQKQIEELRSALGWINKKRK